MQYVVTCWNRLPGEAVEYLSLQIVKAWLKMTSKLKLAIL